MGEQGAEEILSQIAKTELHKVGDKKLCEVLKLSTPHLQQWVRASFLSDSKPSDAMRRFLNMVVKPALSVCVDAVPQQMINILGRYMSILTGTEADEADVANLKIAASALSGDLSMHPLIQGLALQARRQVDKRLRGIETMRGRRSRETETETELIRDAGLSLSIYACNQSLAKEFGINPRSLKIGLEKLKAATLPTPALALNWDAVIKENWLFIEQRYPTCAQTSRCYCPMFIF